MSWFCRAERTPVCVTASTYNAMKECGDMNAKDQRIRELEAKLEAYEDPWVQMGRQSTLIRKDARIAELTAELKDKSFRLEEITAHRDALVVRLEEKQQELADCRAAASLNVTRVIELTEQLARKVKNQLGVTP